MQAGARLVSLPPAPVLWYLAADDGARLRLAGAIVQGVPPWLPANRRASNARSKPIYGGAQGVGQERHETMNERGRNERLQILLSREEVRAIDEFRYQHRLPSRAAAVRDLLKQGLATIKAASDRLKSN